MLHFGQDQEGNMKIRNGFVSNSSSSSFVIAFPHKPESIDEVGRILFGERYGRNNLIRKEYYDDAYEGDIAETIFRDIEKFVNSKHNLIKAIADEFHCRYYFEINSNTFDCDLGNRYHKWIGWDPKYYGNDKKLLKKMEEAAIKEKERSDKAIKDHVAWDEKLCKKYNIQKVSYRDPRWDAYSAAIENARKKDNSYRKYRVKENEDSIDTWKEKDKLTSRMAKIDAKKFIKENTGKCIVILEHEDHNTVGALIDHGNLFKHLEHVRICKH